MPNRNRNNVKRKAYLTKRALVRATKKATHSVAAEAMNLKGYVVKVENGWVVRVHHNGQRERLSHLNASNTVVLD